MKTGFHWVKLPELVEKGPPSHGLPWVCDIRTYDIINTITEGISNAAPGLLAISLCMLGGKEMIYAAEVAAKRRGIRILWWFGPNIDDLSEATKAILRGWVKDARGQVV